MLQDKSTQRNLVPYTDAKSFVRACSRDSCVKYSVEQFDAPGVGFFGLVETSKKNGPLLNMPRCAGFSILECSKLLVLRWHYGCFKGRIELRTELLFTDTDSLAYKIYCRCIMEEMIREVLFDFDLKKALSLFDLDRFSGGDPYQKQLMVKEYDSLEGKLGGDED